jgi:hypothetical protein
LRRKNGFFISLILFSSIIGGSLCAQEADDQTDLVVWDGMEHKSTWHADGKGKLALATEYVTEGRSSLQLSGKGPVTLTKENTYLDLSFAKKFVFDIYNSGAPCQIAVAIYAGQRYESIPKTLQNGLNKNVTFELNAKDFKFILTSENVAQAVEFVVYPQDDTVDPLYIDNVRVKKLGSLASLPPGISPAAGALIAEGFTPVETTPVYTGAYSVGAFPHNPPPNVIPEPVTLFLLGTGAAGIILFKKKSLKR